MALTPARASLALGTLLCTLSWAGPAQAEPPDRWVFSRDDSYGFVLGFMGAIAPPHYGGVVSFSLPVAPTGFSARINDAFFIEIETSFVGRPGRYPGSWFLGGVRYQLMLFEFFGLDISAMGGVLVPWNFADYVPSPYWSVALGMHFPVTDRFAFRIHMGYPGFRLGGELRF